MKKCLPFPRGNGTMTFNPAGLNSDTSSAMFVRTIAVKLGEPIHCSLGPFNKKRRGHV